MADDSGTYGKPGRASPERAVVPTSPAEPGTFRWRLKEIIGSESARGFARRAGVNDKSLRDYLAGSEPSRATLVELARAGGVTVEWLATGEGHRNPATRYTLEQSSQQLPFAMLPLYDVRTGAGRQRLLQRAAPAEHRAYSREWLNQNVRVFEERLAIITIPGDSLEPDLHDGDEVMLDREDLEELREGIYAFCLDDRLLTKRLRLRSGRWAFGQPNDPAQYELSELRGRSDFRLIGRIIGRALFQIL